MNNPEISLGVVGATGKVGQTVLEILPDYGFDISELRLFASESSKGKTVEFEDEQYALRYARSAADFHGLDFVIVSAGGDITKTRVSKEVRPWIEEAGAIDVDNSSAFRGEERVPLVVAGVNDDELRDIRRGSTVANPNCTTMIAMMALKPLHDIGGLSSINVKTYQSVSGQGQEGIDETIEHTKVLLKDPEALVTGKARDEGLPESGVFPAMTAFNVVPFAGSLEGRDTSEELKFVRESRKILGLGGLPVQATCARVPVLNVHSMAISAGFEKEITPEDAEEALGAAPGVKLTDVPQAVMAAGLDEVLVGRIRKDMSRENGLELWVSGDNLRKGAATNAVQIVEGIARQGI